MIKQMVRVATDVPYRYTQLPVGCKALKWWGNEYSTAVLTTDFSFFKPMKVNSLADVDQTGQSFCNNLLILKHTNTCCHTCNIFNLHDSHTHEIFSHCSIYSSCFTHWFVCIWSFGLLLWIKNITKLVHWYALPEGAKFATEICNNHFYKIRYLLQYKRSFFF